MCRALSRCTVAIVPKEPLLELMASTAGDPAGDLAATA